MKYCTNCGIELNDNSSFCSQCGKSNAVNFIAEKSFLGTKYIIEFDNLNKLFKIKSRNSKGSAFIYRYAHLLRAEHFRVENEIIITKTKPGSMLGRAAVGGLLFGGLGAVVGGTTAKKATRSKSKLKKQYIRLYLNNFENPTFDIFIKCTTDGKRIAEKLFSVLQFVVSSTTDDERNIINSSGINPIKV